MIAWPLTGRSEELQLLCSILRGDEGGGVVISGGLGVGKTRLAREVVAALDGDFAIEWVSATPGLSSIPFGALAHLIPEIAIAGADDRLLLFGSITAALAERAADRPLVLAVDDAQFLDAGAAALVHQLAVTRKTLLLFTTRTDVPAPDPIVACWKDGLIERLELQPLGVLDLEALVIGALDRPVDRVTLQRLWALSKGNPLFVRELLLSALEADAFSANDGVWRWTGDLGPTTRLSAILETRLARASAAGRSVLDHLAVGEPLSVDDLSKVCTFEAIAEMERAGLCVVDSADEARLSHPVYGEVLRAAMPTVEQRIIMTRLADVVTTRANASRSDVLRVAKWRLESASAAPSSLFTEAADIANAVYDHDLAERLARRAVAEDGGLRASLALGEALNRQGRCREGLAVLDPLTEIAVSDSDVAAVAVARYFGLTTEWGFRPEFEEVLSDAEHRIRDPQLRAFLRSQRATLLSFAGRLAEAVALASATEAGEELDELSALRAVPALGAAWMMGGKPDAACALAERMYEPALRRREEVPQAPAWVMSTHLPSLVAAGRLDDADATVTFVESLTLERGASADGPSFFALVRGMVALNRGLARSADRWLREATAGMRSIAPIRLPLPLSQLVEACALLGDAEGAATASAEADALVAKSRISEGLVRRARGWAALANGRRSAAVDLFVEAADWAGSNGQHLAELLALHDAVRLDGADAAASRLMKLAPAVEGNWSPCFAEHARAVLEDDADALDAVATRFEQLGAMLLAAEAAARASGAFARKGRTGAAARAAARAGVIAAACENVRTPPLEEIEQPLPLTRREREVAKLAATGMSSQTIAEQLFVSVRTVEGHLQSIYGKLGVDGRRGLTRALGQP